MSILRDISAGRFTPTPTRYVALTALIIILLAMLDSANTFPCYSNELLNAAGDCVIAP